LLNAWTKRLFSAVSSYGRVREPADHALRGVADRAQVRLVHRLTERQERQLALQAILVPRLDPLRRARAPEDADDRVDLRRLVLDSRDVRRDVHGPERHQHLLDGLAAALPERLDEAVGLLVAGNVVEGDDRDPLVPELGRHVPAAGRLLLIARHRAPEDRRAGPLGGQVVRGGLGDDRGDRPLVDVVAHGHGHGARHRPEDQVDAIGLDELPDLGEPDVRLAFRILDDQPDGSARHLAAHLVFPVEPDALVDLRAVDRERARDGIEQGDPDRLALRLSHEGPARDHHRDDEPREHAREPCDHAGIIDRGKHYPSAARPVGADPRGAGAPRSRPSVLKSSSTSGQ